MDSIFDERDLGEEYRIELDRRTGKTGEREASHLVKNNKKLNELKVDRGFDIVKTWEIKHYLDRD